MFLGILASSAYDESAKVTLQQGVAQQVGDDLTLTFKRYIPRQGSEKERMEVEVVRDDGFTYNAYPKFFLNDRTRQLMVNPHIKKTPLQDLYISPIQYRAGATARASTTAWQLAKGETATVGDLTVRFVDFNLNQTGDPAVALAGGGLVTHRCRSRD